MIIYNGYFLPHNNQCLIVIHMPYNLKKWKKLENLKKYFKIYNMFIDYF